MVDTSRYIYTAIEKVFGSNPGRLVMAKTYYSQNLQNIGAVYAYLNDLCGCNFESSAGLHNIAVSSEVTHTISNAVSTAGGVITPSSTCGKVGTLGSFYSCTSSSDTSPTLVATGSELCSLKSQGVQNCLNWARSKAASTVNSKLIVGLTGNEVYASASDSGGCFRVVSGMKTVPTYFSYPNIGSNFQFPSRDVFCNGGTCATEEYSFYYQGYLNTIPPLSVTCVDDVCNTVAASGVAVKKGYTANIPAIPVEFVGSSIDFLSAFCESYLDRA